VARERESAREASERDTGEGGARERHGMREGGGVLCDKVRGLFLQGTNQKKTASERSGTRERARARGFGERQGGGGREEREKGTA